MGTFKDSRTVVKLTWMVFYQKLSKVLIPFIPIIPLPGIYLKTCFLCEVIPSGMR